MATTAPVPDHTKFSAILNTIDLITERTRELVDAIKKPDGNAAKKYAEVHKLALSYKDQVNGLYALASAADRSLQTGKRKEKAQDKAPKEKPDPEKTGADPRPKDKTGKEPTRAERKANRRAARGNAEPEMTGPASDEV